MAAWHEPAKQPVEQRPKLRVVPTRRPAWMDDHDGGVDATIRGELDLWHADYQRERDQETGLYGDRGHDERIGWTKDVA